MTKDDRPTYIGDIELHNVHTPDKCEGNWCVIHNPSDHHMVEWPLVWRQDRFLFERLCEHGIGHPDPDALAFLQRSGVDGADIHGCDGCCRGAYATS